MAPTIAARIMPTLLNTSIENQVPTVSITNATNKLEPAETPNISGPATGFLKNVCMSKPATGKAHPANIAVNAFGSRDCNMIID